MIAEVDSSEDAIAVAADLQPDVVMMDLRMPTVGGVEATRVIVANIFAKLHVADRAEAIVRAREAGLGARRGQ